MSRNHALGTMLHQTIALKGFEMITRSKQNWEVGQVVKVGFLQLRIKSVELTPGDYRPDIYHLTNLAGTKNYQFTPHFGLVSA